MNKWERLYMEGKQEGQTFCHTRTSLPRRAPQGNDKSLDIHLIPNDLDFAMIQAPSMVEYPEWLISLSMVHHKSPAVPFSESPFPSNCLADYNSIDYHPTMALV